MELKEIKAVNVKCEMKMKEKEKDMRESLGSGKNIHER